MNIERPQGNMSDSECVLLNERASDPHRVHLKLEVMLSLRFKHSLKKTEQFHQTNRPRRVISSADHGAKIDYSSKTLNTISLPLP